MFYLAFTTIPLWNRKSRAFFLQNYQWFTFKTKDGLPYFILSSYAYHKAMIFQPEAINNQSPEIVKCSDTLQAGDKRLPPQRVEEVLSNGNTRWNTTITRNPACQAFGIDYDDYH